MKDHPNQPQDTVDTPARLASLRQWEWHWQLYLDLTADEDFEPVGAPYPLTELRSVIRDEATMQREHFAASPPRAGEIRLLSRRVLGDTEYPVYVLLLEPRDEQWLVAPFSRFPAPATSGEWITGMEDRAFHTLCLWNARICPTEALKCAWLAGSVDAHTLEDARNVWASVSRGTSLPADLQERTGVPLRDHLDVRKLWQDDQKQLLKPLTLLATEWIEETAKIAEWEGLLAAQADLRFYRHEVLVGFPSNFDLTEQVWLPAAAAGPEAVVPVLFEGEAQINPTPSAAADGSAARVTRFRQSQEQPEHATLRFELLGVDARPGSRFVLIDPKTPSFPLAGGAIDADGLRAAGDWGRWSDLQPFQEDPSSLILMVLRHRILSGSEK